MTQFTNTVELIRSDCFIAHQGGIFDQKQIDNYKNYLKIKIHEKFEGQTVGKTIIVWSNNLTVILPAIKAIWELGCNIAVHDINVGYTNHPEFKSFYNFLDLIIYDHFVKTSDNSFPDKKFIDFVDYLHSMEYNADHCCPDQPVTSDTVAVKTHSSGTTGTPKIIDISHANAVNVVTNNIKLLKFTDHDRVLHYKTLHHGSLFLNYAIPAFATTNRHFWTVRDTGTARDEFLHNTVRFMQDNKITKFLIPYNWIRLLPSVDPADLGVLSLITIMGPTSQEIKEILDRFGLKEIINNFGCTEVGTMFVSITDQSNFDQYNPNRFEHVMDSLEYEIYPEQLRARYPGMDWQTLADCFEQQGEVLWWRGRSVHVYVDDQKVDFGKIKLLLEDHFRTIDFTIVPDFEKNQLYLATYDDKIPQDLALVNQTIAQSLGDKFKLSQIMKVDIKNVQFGMKPSAPLLLYMFRNKSKNGII